MPCRTTFLNLLSRSNLTVHTSNHTPPHVALSFSPQCFVSQRDKHHLLPIVSSPPFILCQLHVCPAARSTEYTSTSPTNVCSSNCLLHAPSPNAQPRSICLSITLPLLRMTCTKTAGSVPPLPPSLPSQLCAPIISNQQISLPTAAPALSTPISRHTKIQKKYPVDIFLPPNAFAVFVLLAQLSA